MQNFQIGSNEAGQRLDKYLKKLLSQAPAGFLYKMLRKKNITLNGKKADGSEKLCPGDEVKLFLGEETFEKFASPLFQRSEIHMRNGRRQSEPYPYIPLDIIYEDEDLVVINKPSGMLSQKAKPEDLSANEYIIGYLLKQHALTRQDLATFRPSICNRLDRNTSGLLVAGKSLKGLQDMAKQFNSRSMEKYYRCLVKGLITEASTVEGWLKKKEDSNQVQIYPSETPGSRFIQTGYAPVSWYGTKVSRDTGSERLLETHSGQENENTYTLLEVRLMTGRSHQIRAHLASLGHPIVGDRKYGDERVNRWFSRYFQIHSQLLHAYRMVLEDGRELTAPLGQEFQRVLDLPEK